MSEVLNQAQFRIRTWETKQHLLSTTLGLDLEPYKPSQTQWDLTTSVKFGSGLKTTQALRRGSGLVGSDHLLLLTGSAWQWLHALFLPAAAPSLRLVHSGMNVPTSRSTSHPAAHAVQQGSGAQRERDMQLLPCQPQRQEVAGDGSRAQDVGSGKAPCRLSPKDKAVALTQVQGENNSALLGQGYVWVPL